jgi:hypothetical protein
MVESFKDTFRKIKDITAEAKDDVGYGIEKGIKLPVKALLANEFVTFMSCEGHLENSIWYPWVRMSTEDIENFFRDGKNRDDINQEDLDNLNREVLRLQELVNEFHNEYEPLFPLTIYNNEINFELHPDIKGGKHEHVDDGTEYGYWIRKLPDRYTEQTLLAMQKDMNEFAKFILRKKFKETKSQ